MTRSETPHGETVRDRRNTSLLDASLFGEPKENAWLSEDLLRFCSQQGILPYLPIAIDLAKTCFPSLQELHPQREQDPETGEEWLVLDIMLQGDEEKILDAYDRYTDLWVAAVSWPERDKIRLSYNIV